MDKFLIRWAYWFKSQKRFQPFLAVLIGYAFIYLSRELLTYDQHIVILSTTYYPKEKNVIMLANSQRSLSSIHLYVCISKNDTTQQFSYAHLRHAFQPSAICKWSTFTAECGVVENMKNFKLTMHPHIVENSVDIAFTPAYNIKSKVVSCFSPLFYNERWQLILATLEIYKELGVSKQVFYIQSMVSDVFKVLEHYKARGYNEIEPWSKLDIGDLYRNELGYDPNTELDWRNQAAAHTHCFLKYKSAADFIMIGDIDDVLFPKIADNYFDEFLILSQRYPNAAGFTYDRFNTEVTSTKVSSDFSMSRLLDSSVVYNEWEDGKYVVNSSRVSSAWIHWPGIIKNGHTMKLVPRNDNFMLHLRKWKLTESKSGRQQLVHQPKTSKSEKFNIQLGDIINKDVIERIETRWMKNLDTIPGIKHLPTEVRYYPLIANCYNRIFYSIEKRPSSCPGPIKCKLPEIKGLSCTVAQTTFNRHRSKNNYVVHYPESTVFVEKTNGCTL